MDRAEAIKIIEKMDIYCNAVETARDMAIAALREQGQREQECEYCKEYADLPEHIIDGKPIGRVFDTCISHPTNQGWHMEVGNLDIGIQFCPMCGRKLTEPPKEGADHGTA